MIPEQNNPVLDSVQERIRNIAQMSFDMLMKRIASGEDPRTAINIIASQFVGDFSEELTAAFNEMLMGGFSVNDIRALPIGKVDLSRHLYRQTSMTNAVVLQAVKDHVKGFTQARDLAMKIYEGYGASADLLKIKAEVPKYLRYAMQDPAISQGFMQIVARIKANNLKTPALKASYLQAIDAIENGAGQAKLEKQLKVAWYERNRFLANRIAQTELHRAYSNQVAAELMADNQLSWVQIVMSRTHPKTDICDLHSKLNKYGKGEGCYPKAVAPKPPYHPFCRCKIIPRYDLDGDGRLNERAEQEFVRSQSEYDQRLILGSQRKLHDFLTGTPLKTILSKGVPEEYQLKLLSDPAGDAEIQPVLSKQVTPPSPVATNQTRFWDSSTEAGTWHDTSFQNAPEWIKRAISKYKDAPVAYKKGEGAYCSRHTLINMGRHLKDNLRGQSVWRHEFGHWIDGWLGHENWSEYASSMPDIKMAIEQDAKLLTTASGFARLDAKNNARLSALAQIYEAEKNKLIEMAGLEERVTYIRSKWETQGFDFDEAMKQLSIHDSIQEAAITESGYISDLVRLNQMATAISELDAQGFMDAVLGANHEYRKNSFGAAFPEFSDMIGCATKNKVSGYNKSGFGHSNSYLKRQGFKETEVFANVIALQGLGSTFWNQLSEIFMKNTVSAIKAKLI